MKRKIVIVPILTAAVALLFGVIFMEYFISEPVTSPGNACINNLRQIDMAKEWWGLENHKTNGPVSWNDILPQLTKLQKEQGRKVEIPHCPVQGVYTLGDIGELPKCSVKGHELLP